MGLIHVDNLPNNNIVGGSVPSPQWNIYRRGERVKFIMFKVLFCLL